MTPVVLYVEDEESDRLFMAMAFAKERLQSALKTVNDGRAALDYLRGSSAYANRERHPVPHLVLLDLNLPEVHGFDVLKWIRAHRLHSALPVVIFSSSELAEDQDRAQVLGANGFVRKPNSPVLFRKVVRDLNERWLKKHFLDGIGPGVT